MFSYITIWEEGTDPAALFPKSDRLTHPNVIAQYSDDSIRYLFITGVNHPVGNELALMEFIDNAITAEIYRTTPPKGSGGTVAALTFVRETSPALTGGVWIQFHIPHLVCAMGNGGILGWAQSDIRCYYEVAILPVSVHSGGILLFALVGGVVETGQRNGDSQSDRVFAYRLTTLAPCIMELFGLYTELNASPKLLPGCCLAISNRLLTYMTSILPKQPAFTISVGSGCGLLEGLVMYAHPEVSVEGVEVESSINRYIAEERMHVVNGGWGVYPGAQHAAAWMFVYPRDPKLISRYIHMYGDQTVEMILWLGPRADWADYEPSFSQSSFSDLSFPVDVGLAPYELLVVATQGDHERT
ncbi:hypothetical protein P168DRAFT_285535 [Aspergillus campestris IBT 28561]|uniref:Uncharacterized protein n=1 Tax=Aspergillus campestris (strain IBT 28561) TaxID=1392248 RepID=A0A2I1CQV8_ASPC2|nr:uncharacterized protein P168DRAFT_285535 [Aspergillus campestris IBT 28561]PKY00011.1 hypothetical protein P168DRAFT_285535 [Aspergillus campestris IBT 28561]